MVSGPGRVRESSTIQQICKPIGESRGSCAHFLFRLAKCLHPFSIQFSLDASQALSALHELAIVLFACLHAEAIAKESLLVVSSPFNSSNVRPQRGKND